tara:strand:+ start:2045 stop:2242 length:198 start_codon:yes stop_codon:yes gene_type:complete
MRRAKRQPTIDEVLAVVDANPDKVQSFQTVGENAYIMNKGRYNGLGIIYALDNNEYLKFTRFQAS